MALEALGSAGRPGDLLRCLPRIDGGLAGLYFSSLGRVCSRFLKGALDKAVLLGREAGGKLRD